MTTVSSVVTGSQAVPVLVQWQLIDILGSLPSVMLNVNMPALPIDKPVDSAAFGPLGRTDWVVVDDVARGDVFKLRLEFLDDASRVAFENLRTCRRTLLLRSNLTNGRQWYCRCTGKATENILATTGPYETYEQEFTQVAQP